MKRTAMTAAALGVALALTVQAQASTKPADTTIGKLQAASFGKIGLNVTGFDKSRDHDSHDAGHRRPDVRPGREGNKSHGC